MKTPDCSQNAYLRVLVKLMKPVAALLVCMALLVPGAESSAATALLPSLTFLFAHWWAGCSGSMCQPTQEMET